MRNTETGLYPTLEKILRASPEPLDCQTLYDMPDVKQYAASVNRVSDYLGGLWRKGLVTRQAAAPKNDGSRARWEYAWKGQKGPKIFDGVEEEYIPRVIADRPSVLITEEGNVITLEFPNLLISIRQKPGK